MGADLHTALTEVMRSKHLDAEAMRKAFAVLMSADTDPCVASGFLCALATKGETAEELAAAAEVMRKLCVPVSLQDSKHVVDTCGTGGDGSNLFNVSTAAALVAASGGAHVAKHGNRAASGKTGSADVLEALGLAINLSPTQVARCVNQIGIGFMFAPLHHAAMKHIVPVRQALKVPTLFNLLGPLSHPAGAKRQLLGVGREDKMQLMADTLLRLQTEHAMVVHSNDGLDEISGADITRVIEVKAGKARHYEICPEDFSIPRLHDLDALRVSTPKQSAAVIRAAIDPANARERHPASVMVALNGGAALYVAGLCHALKDGVAMAEDLLCSGQVKTKLSDWLSCVRTMGSADS